MFMGRRVRLVGRRVGFMGRLQLLVGRRIGSMGRRVRLMGRRVMSDFETPHHPNSAAQKPGGGSQRRREGPHAEGMAPQGLVAGVRREDIPVPKGPVEVW